MAGDWEKFRSFSLRFESRLKKYNRNLEKRIIYSNHKRGFFKFLNKRMKTKCSIPSLQKGESRAFSDMDKANVLADKFAEVFIQSDDNNSTFNAAVNIPMSLFPWCDGVTVYKLLNDLPYSYSITPDHIPAAFVRKIAHVIAEPLAYLYNQSLIWSEVPLRWKHSFVTPLLKKNRLILLITIGLLVSPLSSAEFLKKFSKNI